MTDIITRMLQTREQVQIIHWQTKSYARHKAYDWFYEEISGLIDTFVEVYQGRHGRIEFPGGAVLQLQDIKELDLNEFLKSLINFFENEVTAQLQENETDLLNIKDEMLAIVNKLVYLLTLN